MKIELRRCIEYTVNEATESVSLDMEDFRTLSIPFTGQDKEEFLDYLQDEFEPNQWDLFDELSKDNQEKLDKFFDMAEWEETYNSALDGETSWYEVGKKEGDKFQQEYNNYK